MTRPVHCRAAGALALEDGDRGRSLLDEPLEFLGRLAVLVPRPRINLILHYGVLGARAAWRRQVVSARPEAEGASGGAAGVPEPETDSAGAQPRGYLWAALMKRTFGFDVLACPGCGGRLRVESFDDVDSRSTTHRSLRH
jgi:hypothetical protein